MTLLDVAPHKLETVPEVLLRNPHPHATSILLVLLLGIMAISLWVLIFGIGD